MSQALPPAIAAVFEPSFDFLPAEIKLIFSMHFSI